MPSGRYTLMAWAGELVGEVPDVVAPPRDTRRRHPPRCRRGHRGHSCARPAAWSSSAPGSSGRTMTRACARVDDGGFSVGGLIPGRRYTSRSRARNPQADSRRRDGTGPGAGRRAASARRRSAARSDSRAGQLARSTDVELQIDGKTVHDENDDGVSAEVGRDCSFSAAVPDQAAAVTVVASRQGLAAGGAASRFPTRGIRRRSASIHRAGAIRWRDSPACESRSRAPTPILR